MLRATTGYLAGLCWLLAHHLSGVACAQPTNPHDELVNTIRARPDIPKSDQDRIARWVEEELKIFVNFSLFRQRYQAQYNNPTNSEAFRRQLAVQTAKIAASRFVAPNFGGDPAYALALMLVEMGRPETRNALIAGLKSTDARARMFCAKGLTAQRDLIVSDRAVLDETIGALREAGLAETSSVVLARIYEGLAFPNQVASVLDSYLAVFDIRLARRRHAAVIVDAAEAGAFEFFRTRAVLDALNADQKAKLVARVATFLRLDAERYDTPGLRFNDIDALERRLDGAEEILAALGASGGGNIREAIANGGTDNRAAVRQRAYRWVGDPNTKEPGALSQAPWNGAIGAP